MKRYLYPRYYQAGGDTKKIDWSWDNSNPFEQTGLQQGLSIAAGTAQLAGSFYDRVKRKDMDQFENQFNQFGDYQFGANSNNSMMKELNAIKTPDKLNYEDVGGITWKEGIGNTLNDTMAGISAGSTFGPWGALIGGVVGGVSGITSSLISAKNSRQDVIDMEKKRNVAINKFNANARFKIQDLNNMNADYMKRQMYAQGGLLDGASNFIEFNAGGSHEQNPLNGVQQGIAPDGQPNLVEEGETRYGDYIFSKRLKPSKSLLKEFNLGDDYVDYSGKSFAEISKALADDSGYTSSPTDPIAIETFDIMMNRLQDAQETHKQRAEQHKMAQAMDKLPDEQKAAIMQQMMMQQPQAGIQDMQPQVYSQPRIGFARGGHLFVTGTPETSSLSEDRQQWIKEHYDRWYKVLKNAGYKGAQLNRLTSYITLQDAYETGYGNSDAWRTKSNAGGMMSSGEYIDYSSNPQKYYTDKLSMLKRKFPNFSTAQSIDEYIAAMNHNGTRYFMGDPSQYMRNMDSAQQIIKAHSANVSSSTRRTTLQSLQIPQKGSANYERDMRRWYTHVNNDDSGYNFGLSDINGTKYDKFMKLFPNATELTMHQRIALIGSIDEQNLSSVDALKKAYPKLYKAAEKKDWNTVSKEIYSTTTQNLYEQRLMFATPDNVDIHNRYNLSRHINLDDNWFNETVKGNNYYHFAGRKKRTPVQNTVVNDNITSNTTTSSKPDVTINDVRQVVNDAFNNPNIARTRVQHSADPELFNRVIGLNPSYENFLTSIGPSDSVNDDVFNYLINIINRNNRQKAINEYSRYLTEQQTLADQGLLMNPEAAQVVNGQLPPSPNSISSTYDELIDNYLRLPRLKFNSGNNKGNVTPGDIADFSAWNTEINNYNPDYIKFLQEELKSNPKLSQAVLERMKQYDGYKGSNWNIEQFITNASNGIYGPAHQEAGLLYDLYRNMEHITPIRINIPKDSITNPTKIIGPTMLMNSEEYQPLGFTFKTLGNFDYNLKNIYIPSINEEITSSTNTESQPVVNGKDESSNKKSDNTKKIKINKIDFPTSTSTPVGLEGQPESLPIDWSPTSFYDENGNFLGEQEDKIYPTWMRYAPVAMSGASVIADFLGANDPDYTNANAIQNSVSRPMMIGYNPVGLYQRWMPSDREYRIAQMNQQSANARNQANMSSNAATARANMAAINNAALNSYGDYAVKVDAQNNVDRNSIIAANNALDLQNAQMALQADRYNQAAYSEWNAQQARANQLAASMREQIDTASAAAKNANRNAFAEGLGNIGLQNFYMNNINTLSMYKVGADGTYYYNGQPVVMLGTNIPTTPTIPQTTDSVIHQAYGGRIGFARRKGGFIVR